jgi:hypothetical protein
MVVLTVNLTQYAPLWGELKHSGGPREIEKNVKFQANF